MELRKIRKENWSIDIETVIKLAQRMIIQIDYYINNEELNETERECLVKSKSKIMSTLAKYGDIDRMLLGFFDDKKKDEIIEDFERIFEIEDTIYKYITLPTWKKFFSGINPNFRQGDSFRYIVHAGSEIINLPGRLGYKKSRNFDADYISASILTNEDVTMFEKNRVGLILEANDSIICGSSHDSNTVISVMPSSRTIFKFNNGEYIDSGNFGFMSGNEDLTGMVTKIQHPAQVMQEVLQKNSGALFGENRGVNEVVLDDSKAKVIGIFFKTNGKEINLSDYIHVKKLEALYKVPVRIVNTSIYRKQSNQLMYTEEDDKRFEDQIMKYSNPENYKLISEHPGWTRQLLRHYYQEVVEGTCFEADAAERISVVFSKMLEFSYVVHEKRHNEWKSVENEDSSVVKIEQCSQSGRNYRLVLKCIDGNYSIECYINGRLVETVDENINEENHIKFFEVYKGLLERYESKLGDGEDYNNFIR